MNKWYDDGMNRRRTMPRALTITNIFGTFGYLSVIFQWAWTVLILAYPMLMNGSLSFLVPETTPHAAAAPTNYGAATPIITFAAIAVTAFVMAMTIFIVAKLPQTIGKQSARTTHAAAHKLTPIVTRRQSISKKRRRILSYRLVLALKAIAVILPLFLLLFATPIDVLPTRIIWIIALFCAACSCGYFVVQQIIALARNVKRDAIW